MQIKQKQAIEMFLRVHDFLGANPPPTSQGYTVQKTTLDDIVSKLTDHSTDQQAGRRLSRAETQRQKALRRKLREEHLGPIAQIARAMLSDAPGIEKALKLPSDSLSILKLVAEANAMRQSIALYAPVFVDAGRPDNFLEQLDAIIEELRDSLLGKARSVGTHVGAKAGLEKEIRRGRRAVQVIDTIVRASFRGKSDTLATWRAAKRIRQIASNAPVTPVAPQPTAPTTQEVTS